MFRIQGFYKCIGRCFHTVDVVPVKNIAVHNHVSDAATVAARNKMKNIEQRAETTQEATHKIVATRSAEVTSSWYHRLLSQRDTWEEHHVRLTSNASGFLIATLLAIFQLQVLQLLSVLFSVKPPLTSCVHFNGVPFR